jgi:hypothetical protein
LTSLGKAEIRMKKRNLLSITALIIMFALSSCGNSTDSSPAADKDSDTNQIEEDSEATTDVASDEEVQGSEETVAVEESTAEAENDPYPYYPWVEQLPDGLEASIQKYDDFTLLVRYTNNTGDVIALYSECTFFDQEGNGINQISTIEEYIKDGDEYVAIFECDDYFEYNLLYCEIEDVGARIKIINEGLSVNSSVNDDGSIHLEMNSTSEDGVSVGGYVFFTDENNNIVYYENIGWGFSGEMSGDTEIPKHEYSDYFVFVTAIS